MNRKNRLLILLLSKFRHFYLCWAICIFGLIFVFVPNPSDLLLLLIIAVSGSFSMFYHLYARTQLKKIDSILYAQCDPETYMIIIERIISSLPNKKTDWLTSCQLRLSNGLVAAGEYEKAYDLLAQTPPFNNNRTGHLLNSVYANNMFLIFRQKGEISNAETYYQKLSNIVHTVKSKKHLQKCKMILERIKILLNMERGNYENAEDFFLRDFHVAKSKYQRVADQYTLAGIYSHLHQTDKAKEALEYVVTHGNELHVVTLAMEKLQTL